MKKEKKDLPIEAVEHNLGQIKGLPANPREWTQDDVDRLAKSLRETPELFDARPLVVTPHKGKYIVLGGNLRLSACRQNGDTSVPVIIVKDIDARKMREIVLKDNGSFGSWNENKLRNDWREFDFAELGITIDAPEDFSKKNAELDIDSMDENITLRLKYHEPQATIVANRLGEDKKNTLLKLLHYAED